MNFNRETCSRLPFQWWHHISSSSLLISSLPLLSLQQSPPSATICLPCTTRRPAHGIRPIVSSTSQRIPVSSCIIAWGKTAGSLFTTALLCPPTGATQKNFGTVAAGVWNVSFGWEEAATRLKPKHFFPSPPLALFGLVCGIEHVVIVLIDGLHQD